MLRTARLVGVGLTALLFGASIVQAEESDGSWHFSMTPYLWATSLNGDATVRGRTASLDASFIDIVEKADSIAAFNNDFELSNGRWTVILAPTYMDMTIEENATIGAASLSAEVDSSLLYVELGGAYRVSSWGDGGARGSSAGGNLELMAGVRYTSLSADIKLDIPPAGVSASVDKTKDWVDPFIGARARIRLSERWAMNVRGDVGGFGAGSDITLQGIAAVGYEFSMFGRDSIVFGGYRALYQDYSDGSGTNKFEWDMTVHGPILGLRTTF